MSSRTPLLARALAVMSLLAFALLPATAVAAPLHIGHDGGGDRNRNPGILPINASAFGNTYGAWSALYWQWAFGQPAPCNPQQDATGACVSVGQSGNVWFLAGTGGQSAERNVTIPAGKALFFPIHQWIFGASVYDCIPSVPLVPCDVPTLRAAAAGAVAAASTVEAWIDGVPVVDVRDYRATSPSSFSVTMVADDVIPGIPAGTYSPHVSDGYWLLLAPMSVGTHTVMDHVVSDFGFEYTLTVHITVVPASGVTSTPTADEFWKSAGADVTPVSAAKRTSWGRVKSMYR